MTDRQQSESQLEQTTAALENAVNEAREQENLALNSGNNESGSQNQKTEKAQVKNLKKALGLLC